MKKLIKTVYKWLPFKKEIFSVIRKIGTPSENVYKHLYFTGVFTTPIKKGLSFKMKHYGYQLENDIFWAGINGKWEKYSLSFWQKLSERSEVIFDIGANTGIYSLISKSVNSTAIVHAFEPIRKVFEKLEKNMQINNFNVHCHEIAASDNTGTTMIFDPGEEHGYAASITNRHSFKNATEIQTIKLDDFICEKGIHKVDLVKIDVEGHEPEVISGFLIGITKFKPTMLIEVLSEDVGSKINSLLEGKGYLFYNIDEKTGLTKVECITKSSGYNFLICQPEIANMLELNAN